MKRKIVSIVLLLLSIICLTSGSILLWQNKHNNTSYETVQKKIKKINNDKEFIKYINELNKKNEDIIGYIIIPDTNVNYPVVQGKDNDYYLNHDYLKNKIINGSIFLSYKGDIENQNVHNIIYGHNTEDNSMFADLQKYKNYEFYEKHKTFKLYTLNNAYEYEIVSVFLTRVFYKYETDVFKYYNYINFDENSYIDFITNIKALSLYDTGVTAEYGEALISLSTCEYSQDNGRLIVTAKRVSK